MADPEPTLPPCGHTDRLRQLTEIAFETEQGQPILFLACSVPECPEFCRVFADLRDPEAEVEEHGDAEATPGRSMRAAPGVAELGAAEG